MQISAKEFHTDGRDCINASTPAGAPSVHFGRQTASVFAQLRTSGRLWPSVVFCLTSYLFESFIRHKMAENGEKRTIKQYTITNTNTSLVSSPFHFFLFSYDQRNESLE